MGELHIEWCYAPIEQQRVRWFSYRAPYAARELAKATEVPHRGSLLRFCDADSAALEDAYRAHHEELERAWWQEEAELQTGGTQGAAAIAAEEVGWAHFMAGDGAGDEPGVLVRSGAFEVDLRRRHLRPCYWPAGCHRVLRGTWFVEKGAGEWVPLKESLAEQLEEGYRQALWLPARGRLAQQPAGGGFAARLELTTHVERGLYALFASEDEAWLCQETGWAWLRKIGASATAGQQRLRLRRGYEQPASKALLEKEADLRQEELDEACAALPAARLLLVVHGIGQRLEGANIAQDAASFRSVLRQVAAQQQDGAQPGALDEQASGRTEVLPVQWRKQLQLEADQQTRALMPPGIPALRSVLHSTVVEILLFMTPAHRAEIVGSLVASLNAAHARFVRRNPGFDGAVSVLSHSLGSVLCYDVLCAQPLSPQLVDAAGLLPAGAGAAPGSPQGPAALPEGGGEGGGGGGGEGMEVDAPPEGPTAALRQELARLRGENQRLQLQLELAQAGHGAAAGSDSPAAAAAAQRRAEEAGGSAAAAWPGLRFSVDALVMLGSPLGCFLALRGVGEASGAPLGSPASGPLMRLAPGQPASPDGLPAVRRLLNVYHPFDPVAHRVEPLALPAGEVPRPAIVPLFKGGKRIHLAVQEFSEDVGSAASRIGTTLLSSIAFSRFKGSATYKAQHGGGGGEGARVAAAAAAAEAAEAAEAAAEEEAARRLGGTKPGPAPGGEHMAVEEAERTAGQPPPYASLSFGAVDEPGAGALSGEASDSASPLRPGATPGAGAVVPASPAAGGALAAAGGGRGAAGAGGLARVAGGVPVPGGKTAQGRLDFVLQESTLENQYLSALSAHFSYWTSPDVALLVLRAVHGVDVVTGAGAGGPEPGDTPERGVAPSPGGAPRGGGRRPEPTSPRQVLLALP